MDHTAMATVMESLRGRTAQLAHGFLYGNGAQPPLDSETFPWDVRYALDYKVSAFRSPEINSLIKTGFLDQAAYLVVKGFDSKKEEQKKFLENYTRATVAAPNDQTALKPVLETALQENSDISAEAGKLAQISRQGFVLWNTKFAEIATETAAENRTPILIAYAAFMGLRHVIDANTAPGAPPLLLIAPTWINDPDNPYCGYELDPKKEDPVQFLEKSFKRPESFALIDDTRRNGGHITEMLNFLHADGSKGKSEHVAVPCYAPKTLVV